MIPFLHTPPSLQILCHVDPISNGKEIFLIFLFRFYEPSGRVFDFLIRLGVYAKDGLPLGTISMNPLSLSHIRIGVCTLAKTFFCGWGPQKYEWGAPWFLQSSIAILSRYPNGF